MNLSEAKKKKQEEIYQKRLEQVLEVKKMDRYADQRTWLVKYVGLIREEIELKYNAKLRNLGE